MGQLIRVLLEVLRQMTKPKQWIGLRENLHETIVFTMKYSGVPVLKKITARLPSNFLCLTLLELGLKQ